MSLADQRMARLVEVVIIARQRADVHQALHRHLGRLGVESVLGHAGDDGVHLGADPLAHVDEQLVLDQLALRHLRPAFHLRAVLAQNDQLAVVALRMPLLEDAIEQAVDDEVRIPANRRREVAVILACQGVMLLLLRTVRRLLQATQHRVVDGPPLGLLGRVVEQLLEREAVGFVLDLVAEMANELGERMQLRRLRGRMDATQECDLAIVDASATDSFAVSMNSSIT